MRSRLLTLLGGFALAIGGLLVPATPAAAAPAHCSGWNTHPDVYNKGDIVFGNGTYMRTGPYTDCPANGQGYPGHGLDAHCFVSNANNVAWIWVDDTTTGERGWAQANALHYTGDGTIAHC